MILAAAIYTFSSLWEQDWDESNSNSCYTSSQQT